MDDMMQQNKEAYEEILKVIKADSAVGIDAPLTHAVIIKYLQDLTQKMDRIEKMLVK